MAFAKREDTLALQLQAFSNGIFNNAGLYGVSVPESVSIKTGVEQFVAARVVCNEPTTRTAATIEQKNALKASILGLCRTIYGLIQRNQGISNEDKIAIGVTPLGGPRSVRPCPQTSPSLTVVASTPGAQTVEFRDSTDLSTKAKPLGADVVQLFVAVADEAASDPSDAKFVGNFTTNPMPVVFDAAERGKQATYFARWGGKRNNTFGQWSLPVSMTIAA